MHKSSLIAAIFVGTAFAAGPAMAKTSVAKSTQLCEAAARAETPAPKSVRADDGQTRISDETVTVLLKVKTAENTSATLTCIVDRETATPTLKPSP